MKSVTPTNVDKISIVIKTTAVEPISSSRVGQVTFCISARTSRKKFTILFITSPILQARRDSNPQQAVLETAALPIGATGLKPFVSVDPLDGRVTLRGAMFINEQQKYRKQPLFAEFKNSVYKRLLFLLFMNRMFSAKRAVLLELNTLRMKLFIFIGRVISAVTRRAAKLDELSHKDSPKINIGVF